MRVLLATPPMHYRQAYSFKYPRFPWLSLPVLAGAIRDRHQVRLVSFTHLRDRAHDLDAEIAAFRPDVLGFAVPAPLSAAAIREQLPAVKRRWPGLRVIAGGQYPTFCPEPLLRAGCDLVCLGEADRTLPVILERWAGGAAASALPGVAYLADDAVQTNALDDVPAPLDDLPLPAFDLWPATHRTVYRAGIGGALESSRGCPHHCNFCTLPAFHRRYREKSNARVLAEWELLWKLGAREIMLVDATFAVDPAKTTALAEALLASEMRAEFIAFMRADTIARHPALIALLARAGLCMAIVGFESYSDDGLRGMDKAASATVNREAAAILRRANVFVSGSHIYGAPGETAVDALRTYRRGARLCDHYLAGLYTPLPGSPSAQALRAAGRLPEVAPDQLDYTRVLGRAGSEAWRVRWFAALLYLWNQCRPSRLAAALAGAPLARAVHRAEYRLLAQRLYYGARRRLGGRVL